MKTEHEVYAIKGERLACLIANCHMLLRRSYRGMPLWSLVSDITGHGSTVAKEICVQCNYDPHQDCGGKTLKRNTT